VATPRLRSTSRRSAGAGEPRYRRSPHLIAQWTTKGPVVENFATGQLVAGLPIVQRILTACDRWRTIADVSRLLPEYPRRSIAPLIRSLAELALLQRSDRDMGTVEARLEEWNGWNPAAAYFHCATRDVTYSTDLEAAGRQMRAKARRDPLPAAVKRYRGLPVTRLPKPDTDGEFARVLQDRRTWRRFSRTPSTLAQLSDVLGLTFRVQRWIELPGIGRVALKTSPSGGARHPIECYVLALRVRGLPRGLYHYRADTHALERLPRTVTARHVARYLPGQGWYGNASVVVLMTAVFARTRWRYSSPRAYRVVLAETGHLCQTFCLAASWRGLAPFCTMALADSVIERDVGIDGISEAVMYAAGFGTRPAGAAWAPWPTEEPYQDPVESPGGPRRSLPSRARSKGASPSSARSQDRRKRS
jgi:SagB-type dehydrogenase family enzyme